MAAKWETGASSSHDQEYAELSRGLSLAVWKYVTQDGWQWSAFQNTECCTKSIARGTAPTLEAAKAAAENAAREIAREILRELGDSNEKETDR